MRAFPILAFGIVLLVAPALAHGGTYVVEYVGGAHMPGTKDPAACVGTPLRLYGVTQHLGGACDIQLGHPDRAAVTASADDVADAPFFWRMVDAHGETCAEGEFVGSAALVGPLRCARISVYAPVGSASGVISVTG